MNQKTCIIIAGPTASGKTDAAIAVAEYFNTEIISADSRQCYRELNIGVAKPTPLQLSAIPHHFINSHSITDNLSAADFEKYALTAAEKIFLKHDVAVVCGGTGLYIQALCNGLDPIPEIPAEIKKIIAEEYACGGINRLQEIIKAEDILFWQNGEIQNPHRIIRALEVIRSTGKSILTHQQKNKKPRNFNTIKIVLDIPRNELYERINKRTLQMREAGLEDEAKKMLPYKHLNALQTVGYRELFDHFENNISADRAFELIMQNTRHYAKRQITWFKKDPEMTWAAPGDVMKIIAEKFS